MNGAIQALDEKGFIIDEKDVFWVPGAFELPAKVKSLANTSNYKCIIALGCVIKGETDHYHYISKTVASGIMSVTLEIESVNIIFGVLTCQNKELALARSGDDLTSNKGYEAGIAAISLIHSDNI